MRSVLVTTDWLARNPAGSNRVILDCSWHLPESGRSGHTEFIAGHIPGARYIDLNDISDGASAYANMMPPAEQFAAAVEGLGISNDTEVIIYDVSYVSSRVWWMFRSFGHDNVSILDGGWRKWKAEGRAIESGEAVKAERGRFEIAATPPPVVGWPAVSAASKSGKPTIVDARTAERFSGAQSSGYPGVPGGHIPGSVNIPWSKLFKPDFTFVSPEEARAVFVAAGVDPTAPAIATCGSGVTAAILVMMLERLGNASVRLYDGSWHEWGQRSDLPKETSA